jgi:hypothetical protein
MHSIVTELWDEWSSLPPEDEETDSAEVAGLVVVLPVKKAEPETVALGSSRLWALRRLAKLWKNSHWKNELNIAAAMRVPPDMKGRVELVLPRVLYEKIAASAERRKWAWARGVWGGGGALYVPKSGYYLAVRIESEAVAKRAGRVLRSAWPEWSERLRGRYELILRDQQGIVTFLSKIGLTGVSLRLEDKAVLRSMRDQANRVSNCDTANIKKALKAAEEQTILAQKLLQDGLVPALPFRFRDLVEVRLEHPEESLSDLGKRLSPPVTKSTVKYRWRRLCEFVDKTIPAESGRTRPVSTDDLSGREER